jgi:hypothetical protein
MMSLPNEGRGLVRFLMLAVVTVALSSVVARANIIYPVNTTITSSDPTGNALQSNTVSGSITTDGTIGVIGTSNILSWDLNLIDGLSAANDFELTPADSAVVEDTGSALSATATGLSFNFSGTGEFLIQAIPGAFSGSHYFCFSTGNACLAGETISPQFITVDGVVATGAAEPIGQQPLAPPAGSAPEPSSYGLMITGALGVGAVLKRRLLA